MKANTNDHQPSTDNEEQSHLTKGLIRLTMACNEQCPFCNVPQEDYERPTPAFDEVLEQVKGFIARGDRTLTISGGEPTLLKKRLIELTTTASQGGIDFIEIQTNAVLIDAPYAQALRAAGVTSAFVSLLSHQAHHHDILAGLNGAFDKCIRGIDALLDAGIRVALNPVTARATQDLLADYVDFVADRLPRIKSISLSAVQPHGRAAHNLDLLPDYDRLSTSVKNAQTRAEHHGIRLLNPYCGLPLCVGWSDRLATSVVAIEAQAPHNPQGVDNQGNKRHGAPCRPCGLRSRCGGAWHAIWDHSDGAGISAPWTVTPPWKDDDAHGQDIIDARTETSFEALLGPSDSPLPVRWLWAHQLDGLDLGWIRSTGVTHIALDHADLPSKATLAVVRKLIRSNQLVSPQRRIQVYLRSGRDLAEHSPHQVVDLFALFEALGFTEVWMTKPGPHTTRINASHLSP